MSNIKKIRTALISVYNKDGLEEVVTALNQNGVKIYSTGGTQKFIENLGISVTSIEELTGYPSIFDGRVKTLHPKVFGGILAMREDENHQEQLQKYEIPEIDLVIVDLYPFDETVKAGGSYDEIIEKIDIGGVSLIRAAAKNHKDVVIISMKRLYPSLLGFLNKKNGKTTLEIRTRLAAIAFFVTSTYDDMIYYYLANKDNPEDSSKDESNKIKHLRYGENPHQKGAFMGDFNEMFEQLNGKEISYNNILDIDAATTLISDFEETTCAILKHNNACGIASRPTLTQAWKEALAGDPTSAYGGIVITNVSVDAVSAAEIDKIFIEIIIAPSYSQDALEILKKKKNRIILILKNNNFNDKNVRDALNGFLYQEKDKTTETIEDLKAVTVKLPTDSEYDDLLFANKIVKHSKSNAIVLAKNRRLIGSGVGQTSRVDALKQAISKARSFDFDLKGAVMASDAFFPFSDCVQIAGEAGITAIIQPGGSIRDNETIEYCNNNNISMVFTGTRHFKH